MRCIDASAHLSEAAEILKDAERAANHLRCIIAVWDEDETGDDDKLEAATTALQRLEHGLNYDPREA